MSEMLEMIRTLGDQFHWARNLDVPTVPQSDEMLVLGMGGSGIAGDVAGAISFESAGRVSVHKGYAPLAGWVEARQPLVVAVSYSGNTEETLDVCEEAKRLEVPMVAVTTGGRLGDMAEVEEWPTIQVPTGLQPRAALGYLAGAVVRVAAGAGLLPDQADALAETADLAAKATEEGSDPWNTADSVASGLEGRIPIVYGGGVVSGAAAQRWKTQLNENAKTPAWWSLLPELDHNEVVGWEAMPEKTRDHLAVVALTDSSDHRRVGARREHTRSLTGEAVPWVAEVASRGNSTLARLVSLTTIGDLASWMLAERSGVDPVAVDTIEELKSLLREG